MSENTAETAVDESTADSTTDATTDAATAPDAAEVRDPAKLLSAYEAEKAKRKEAEAERRTLREEFDALRAKVEGKEAEHAATLKERELEAAALGKANERILKAEIRAAAAAKLADPADALQFLDLSAFEVGADGEVDGAAVASAIDALIQSKPYLAAQGKRFQGDADGGARNDSSAPSQLTAADMARMTPEQIDAAHIAGRFSDLLGGA